METDTPKYSEDYTISFREESGDTYVSVDGDEVAVLRGIVGANANQFIGVGNYRTA